MTPQQRWWALRARLPRISRWQGGVFGALVLFFGVVVLPYLLPLGGLPETPAPNLADPNGAFVTINGVDVYFTQRGTGEAVLFVHGFWGSSVDWRGVMAQTATYNTYAIDLPGLGLSQKGLEQDLSHPAQADLLAAFMESQGIPSAHIVGHDMGGNIAVHLAQRHPMRVKTLTLVAPALQYEPTPAIPDWALRMGFAQRWARILLRGMMPEAARINLYSAAAQEGFITPSIIKDYQRPYHTADWDLAFIALGRDSHHSALAAPLEEMNLPVLILWGAADSWVPPSDAEKLAEAFPNARSLLFPQVGHLPMHEAPAAFTAALLAFWAE